jgi:hypothetical protein
MLRKLSADQILMPNGQFLSNGVLIVDNTENIIDISYNRDGYSDCETFKGILCPGFINYRI